jgi:hypothetical protein
VALPTSSLSLAVRSVADFLAEGLGGDEGEITVTVGSPHDAIQAPSDLGHRVNLFLYRIEPDAHAPSPAPDRPLRLRLHCLVTAFGIDGENISAGETDLRLLGEVIRLFHEHPTLEGDDHDGGTVRLHAVFEPLTPDVLSSVWSNQHETSLRPSVAYEVSVVLVASRRKYVAGPLTGALGLGVGPVDAVPSAQPAAPEVPRTEVDVTRDDWVPHIAWVAGGRASYALTIRRSDLAPLAVWIAGRTDAKVSLRWQTWHRETGWTDGATVEAAARASAIDPETAAAASVSGVTPPAFSAPGQATLRAVRSWTRPDGGTIELQSNVILLTVVEDVA